MYRRDILSSIAFLLIFALALAMTASFPETARMFPRIICVLGLCYSLAILSRAAIHLRRGEEQSAEGLSRRDLRNLIITLASGFLYVALIPVIGYMVTTFVFLAAFSFYLDRGYKKYCYLLFAGGFVLVLYLAFAVFLTIPLPRGILF